MSKFLVLEPNTEKRIREFAEMMNIPLEKAQYIEHMRAHYITHEYDYIKKPSSKALEAR